MKPMKIKFQIEVDVDKKGNYKLFGMPSHICMDHSKNEQKIKECFLDVVVTDIQWFVLNRSSKMTKGAEKARTNILDSIILVGK